MANKNHMQLCNLTVRTKLIKHYIFIHSQNSVYSYHKKKNTVFLFYLVYRENYLVPSYSGHIELIKSTRKKKLFHLLLYLSN